MASGLLIFAVSFTPVLGVDSVEGVCINVVIYGKTLMKKKRDTTNMVVRMMLGSLEHMSSAA